MSGEDLMNERADGKLQKMNRENQTDCETKGKAVRRMCCFLS